ncbi:aquaporin-8-like [Arapaima gigas]
MKREIKSTGGYFYSGGPLRAKSGWSLRRCAGSSAVCKKLSCGLQETELWSPCEPRCHDVDPTPSALSPGPPPHPLSAHKCARERGRSAHARAQVHNANMSGSESKTELCEMGQGGLAEAAGPGIAPGRSRRRGVLFERYVQPCVAELLGCALFIFVGCSSVVENPATTGALQPALAHGLALGIAIAVLGQISGGHFNPAVSVSVCLIGGLQIVLLLPYILSQMLGGLIGAGLARAIATPESYANSSGGAFNVVTADSQVGRAVMAEMVMTVFLTMTVCMGAVNCKTRSLLAPLCIGFTVAADILAGAKVSGACMNPARAFGPAVVSGYWDYHWIYWVGPLAGALITAFLIRLLVGDEKIRVFFN